MLPDGWQDDEVEACNAFEVCKAVGWPLICAPESVMLFGVIAKGTKAARASVVVAGRHRARAFGILSSKNAELFALKMNLRPSDVCVCAF